ncbi:MAG: hypothetical protein KDA73_01155 [Rhodobacteraceae bacterium]|nr:hypothetical protein [Paracoccaceae bacterium]
MILVLLATAAAAICAMPRRRRILAMIEEALRTMPAGRRHGAAHRFATVPVQTHRPGARK